MAKILFVDDDEMVRYSLTKYLSRAGFDVETAEDGRVALNRMGEADFDLVITDIVMPNVEGLELIKTLRQRWPETPIIAISGGGRMDRSEYLSIAELFGVNATLEKPLDPDELVSLVQQQLT